MRVALAVIAAVIPGCSFAPGMFGGASTDDASGDDAEVFDGRADAPANLTCYGKGLAVACHPNGQPPTNTYSPSSGTINTGTNSNCTEIVPQTDGPELCVIVAQTVSITSDLVFIGPRPVVILGTQLVEVSGEIDVSEGAGSNTGTCVGGAAGQANTGASAVIGGGGGGGGGYGSDGGDGADGSGAATGGNGVNAFTPTIVRGGCSGFKGGDSNAGSGAGGGTSGGALYLISGGSISISGRLDASGGGGSGSSVAKAGGGGGGSGGLIGLDAPSVTVNAFVWANGGGGGEGGGGSTGGSDGEDPTFWSYIPNGGSGNVNGGNGGNGAYTNVAALSGSTADNGGGGGGGGAGRILVYYTTSESIGASVSPAPTITMVP